jgi:hypothetical protein
VKTRDLTGNGWLAIGPTDKTMYLIGMNAMAGLVLPSPQFDDFFGTNSLGETIELLDAFYANPRAQDTVRRR